MDFENCTKDELIIYANKEGIKIDPSRPFEALVTDIKAKKKRRTKAVKPVQTYEFILHKENGRVLDYTDALWATGRYVPCDKAGNKL